MLYNSRDFESLKRSQSGYKPKMATTDPGTMTTAGPTTTAPGGPTTTGAPAPPHGPMTSWEQFGISSLTFVCALIVWVGVCWAISKWEDSKSGAGDSADIKAATYVAEGGNTSAVANPGNSAYASGSDAGYMPVAIPEGGQQPRI